MFSGKYHIVIFKERTGDSRNLRLRGWLGVLLFVIVGGLAGGNVWFWRQYQENTTLKAQIVEAERTIEDQSQRISSMVTQITSLEDDLQRVQQFDAKLRLMMNMERDPENTAVGGFRREDFSRTYLPMHRQELMVRKMSNFLKQLSNDIRLEEVRQQELLQTLRNNREQLASLPSIWPIEGFLSSRFGYRLSPFTGRRDFHRGLDITARSGTPIQSPSKGKVVFAGVDGAYGNCLVIEHGAGLSTRYAHMQRSVAKEGQIVRRGEIIGFVGSSGRSTGPHLHYEVKLHGVNVDPMRYILN